MQWTPGGSDNDIEDRRDEGGGGGSGFGGFGGIHLGVGGTIILVVLSVVFRTNLFTVISGGPTPTHTVHSVPDAARDASEKNEVEFVKFVLNDVQANWERLLPQSGKSYHHAKLVLFRDETRSGCGDARSATGPFYCPQDEKVYLDLGFFDELKKRFAAPGEFAQAYVIAHEIGHHVQKLLGIEGKVRQLQERQPSSVNRLSVGLELQADCFAGVWASSTEQRKLIDQNDISAGLRAAAAVGDDRLQRMATGHVNPESFTHGSSAQRMRWFKTGLDSGRVSGCNTFRQPQK
jgi:predicted metalloprotease